MRKFIITIWNTVNMSRDIDLDNPETTQYNYEIEAENEEQAYESAKHQNYSETNGKGVWEHEIYRVN